MQSIGLVFKQEHLIMVALRQGLGTIDLEGHQVLSLLEVKEEETEAAILHNLERFCKTYRGGSDNVFIALPRDAALVQFLNLPLAVEEDLRATLGYEMDRHTPFSFDEVYFDYHVVQRYPENNLLHVMLVTVRRDLVDRYLNLLGKMNIRPRGIELTTTALCNVTHMADAPPRKLFDLSPVTGHPLFRKYALAPGVKLAPRLAALAQEPAREQAAPHIDIMVEYLHSSCYELNLIRNATLLYSKTFRDQAEPAADHFQRMHASGLKALIHVPYLPDREAGLRFVLSGKAMEQNDLEQVPEEIRPAFSVARHLPAGIRMHGEHAPAPALLPLLSVPVGAALKGLLSSALDINLIPPERRPRKKRSKKKIGAAVALAAGISLGTAYVASSIRSTEMRLAVLNEQLAELKQQVSSIEELQREAETISAFSTGIEKIRATDVGKLAILKELTELIPEDSWLTDFQYETKKKNITISGYASSASKLIPLLEDSKLFENVKFTSPITTDRLEKKEKFRIEMAITLQEPKP